MSNACAYASVLWRCARRWRPPHRPPTGGDLDSIEQRHLDPRRPYEVPSGHAATISGTLAGPGGPTAGKLLELQLDPVPYGRFINAAHTVTAVDGDYRFAAVRLYRDTHFRVVVVGPVGLFGPTVEVLAVAPAYPSWLRVRAAARYLAGRSARLPSPCSTITVGWRGSTCTPLPFGERRQVDAAGRLPQMLARQHRSLDSASRALLYPMIHSSDNEAASAVLAIVGEAALNRVARDAHMVDYESGGAFWGFTEVSAADLARFFLRQQRSSHANSRVRTLVLSSIEPSESWGIPAVARPEFQVFFKGGWLPEFEDLVNQAARLERPGIVFGLAVLTIDNPSMVYGGRRSKV